MKAVLISIQPKWCELIANGKKTIEVRKTKPKLETPFKVYIYCTKNKRQRLRKVNNYVKEIFITENKDVLGRTDKVKSLIGDMTTFVENGGYNGKVIGEFVCDWIESTPLWRIKGNTGFCAKRTDREENLPKMACLSIQELEKYAGSENRLVYGWHISNLVIYDKPRELSEFRKPIDCHRGKNRENCIGCWDCEIKRPPQSWCYVESEVQGE